MTGAGLLLMMIVVPGEDAVGVAVVGVADGVAGADELAGAVTVTRAAGAAAGVVPHAARPPIRASVPIPAKMVFFTISPNFMDRTVPLTAGLSGRRGMSWRKLSVVVSALSLVTL